MDERNNGENREDREQTFDPIVHEYYETVESGEPLNRQATFADACKFVHEIRTHEGHHSYESPEPLT